MLFMLDDHDILRFTDEFLDKVDTDIQSEAVGNNTSTV
jgi:hypothetical protein